MIFFASKKKPWRDPAKRIIAKMLGKEYINVWTCQHCHHKWDRISVVHPWIVCPNCGKSGAIASKNVKREKLATIWEHNPLETSPTHWTYSNIPLPEPEENLVAWEITRRRVVRKRYWT